ncbi:hypothetical protein TorRG33x02_310890 [Trema orientale]|uniref:Uncharacterized protein n=1 Tax=Trema orientale TaxID=63057 RepID=A0A2P5BS91_TREOI|nr:hypothetical protein TorRG33x02_310890 [Trema orientale]
MSSNPEQFHEDLANIENNYGEKHDAKDANKEWTVPEVTIWNNLLICLGIDKKVEKIDESDMIDKDFISMERAEKFYELYAKLLDFNFRKKLRRKK